MPEFDFGLLCEYVRTERGIAHVIGATIDTIGAEEVPTGVNLGLLMRLQFTRNECDRPHRLEVIVQDADGTQLVRIDTTMTPTWIEGLPAGWKTSALGGLNFGVPIPAYGEFSAEIMVNDTSVKSLPFRVIPPAQGTQGS